MNKRGIIFIFLVGIFVFILPNVNSDVISINSGGGTDIAVDFGGTIESFFFGGGSSTCMPTTCSALGYNCGDFSDGCNGTLSCGSCSAGNTCTSGICTPTGGGNNGGTSGGTTFTGTTVTPNIFVSPTEIKLDNMIAGEAQQVTITVTNNGTTTQNLQVNQKSLDKVVILGVASIDIAPGEVRKLDVTFVSLDAGNFAGTIYIGSQSIPVDLNVRTEKYLFDSNIIVLNKNYQIPVGSPLRTQVGLIPQGQGNQRTDVTLNYAIKDYTGKIYLTQSETLLITKAMNFGRNFQTGMLPLGNYTISLELIYPNGVAPSSAHFTVTSRSVGGTIASILLFLITGILVVSIMIVLVLIRLNRHR